MALRLAPLALAPARPGPRHRHLQCQLSSGRAREPRRRAAALALAGPPPPARAVSVQLEFQVVLRNSTTCSPSRLPLSPRSQTRNERAGKPNSLLQLPATMANHGPGSQRLSLSQSKREFRAYKCQWNLRFQGQRQYPLTRKARHQRYRYCSCPTRTGAASRTQLRFKLAGEGEQTSPGREAEHSSGQPAPLPRNPTPGAQATA